MTHEKNSLLGKQTSYDSPYDPGLLFPLERREKRAILGIDNAVPFKGEDLWTCYELSWLASSGKPCVGIGYFRIPFDSPFMIESKSFKLYLNSLNHKSFDDVAGLQHCLTKDLSHAAGAPVTVEVKTAGLSIGIGEALKIEAENVYHCIDGQEISGFEYQPNADLLVLESGDKNNEPVEEFLYSDLLRSNCPVTGQPDWGTVLIHYQGQKISHEALLRYIVSFRQCQDFHEHCVERMFVDLQARCVCDSLSVYARYTRRGGLDINPYRASADLDAIAPVLRTERQ